MTAPQSWSETTISDPASLIAELQTRLLALGRDLANPDSSLGAAEIDRMAKAINSLIPSVERSDAFLRAHGHGQRPGDRLRGVPRQVFLRKIKRLVEKGLLDEIED